MEKKSRKKEENQKKSFRSTKDDTEHRHKLVPIGGSQKVKQKVQIYRFKKVY